MKPFVLLAVFAHPDDEAFGTGGTLARYAAEGCDVYLVTATRGEAGQIALPTLATPANLPAVREAELRCACRSYGIHPPIFLDYVDGQLPIVHQGQAVARLVRIIRETRSAPSSTWATSPIRSCAASCATLPRWARTAATPPRPTRCWPITGSAARPSAWRLPRWAGPMGWKAICWDGCIEAGDGVTG